MIDIRILGGKSALEKKLRRDKGAAIKALGATMRDLKRRGPTQVAKAVTEVYAIKSAEVKPGKGNGGASSVRAGGGTVAGFNLVYTGRPLTPLHFKMTPTAPTGRRYKIKATVLKGQRKVIGSWGPKGSEGGRYARPARSPYFLTPRGGPPLRREASRLKAMRTLSVPQMVGNDAVAADATARLAELAEKRLDHHLNRFLE